VGTPPNAVAAGSGLVSLGRRVRAGIGVNQRFALLLPTML
jgi:sodium-dependent dicarboxylate transporter 2/3/5